LIGSSQLNLKIGDTYVESGFQASDNVFGDMQSKVTITGDVNTSKAGTYEIIYSVVDIAGNVSGSVKRTVVISNEITENPTGYWWSGADNIRNGFYQNWLGQFMPFESGWIYHLDFGWVYVFESNVQGLWMWMQDEGWLWSDSTIWPFIWSNDAPKWLYFWSAGQSNFFYDYSSQSFRPVTR
jgi:hypothetical protein